MILLLALATLFTKGDTWSYDLTVHYKSEELDVDLVDKESVKFSVTSATKSRTDVEVERVLLYSLEGEDRVPPAKGTKPDLNRFSFDNAYNLLEYQPTNEPDIDRVLRLLSIAPASEKRTIPKAETLLKFRVTATNPLKTDSEFQLKESKGVEAHGKLSWMPKLGLVQTLHFEMDTVFLPGTTNRARLTVDAILKDHKIQGLR